MTLDDERICACMCRLEKMSVTDVFEVNDKTSDKDLGIYQILDKDGSKNIIDSSMYPDSYLCLNLKTNCLEYVNKHVVVNILNAHMVISYDPIDIYLESTLNTKKASRPIYFQQYNEKHTGDFQYIGE